VLTSSFASRLAPRGCTPFNLFGSLRAVRTSSRASRASSAISCDSTCARPLPQPQNSPGLVMRIVRRLYCGPCLSRRTPLVNENRTALVSGARDGRRRPLGGPGRNGAHQVAQLGGGHGPCCPNVEPKAGCGRVRTSSFSRAPVYVYRAPLRKYTGVHVTDFTAVVQLLPVQDSVRGVVSAVVNLFLARVSVSRRGCWSERF
jgi:hypothetical protein